MPLVKGTAMLPTSSSLTRIDSILNGDSMPAARPKSVSLTWPVASIKKFSGLRSRWM